MDPKKDAKNESLSTLQFADNLIKIKQNVIPKSIKKDNVTTENIYN